MNKQVLACILSAALVLAALTGCSETQSRATCFDCTTTPQKWSDFGFEMLEAQIQSFGLEHAEGDVGSKASFLFLRKIRLVCILQSRLRLCLFYLNFFVFADL